MHASGGGWGGAGCSVHTVQVLSAIGNFDRQCTLFGLPRLLLRCMPRFDAVVGGAARRPKPDGEQRQHPAPSTQMSACSAHTVRGVAAQHDEIGAARESDRSERLISDVCVLMEIS